MKKQVNLQLVYGAGPDNLYGGGLRELQKAVKAVFGEQVYSPSILDYTEYEALIERYAGWSDPTIFVGHSCGCNPITHIQYKFPRRRVPFLLAIAPSMFCPVAYITPNVERATQATSNALDMFNIFGRQLVQPASGNNKTKIDVIRTNMGHVAAPYSPFVKQRLLSEVQLALT